MTTTFSHEWIAAVARDTAPAEITAEEAMHLDTDVADAPQKLDVLGVQVSKAGPEQVADCIVSWAASGRPAIVDFMPVHGLIEARRPGRLDAMNQFDIVACDGQPVRWAMNKLHGAGIAQRVYGPTCMEDVCERCAKADVGVYLYGSSQEVIDTLSRVLPERYPGLRIVGAESPPYRALTEAEEDAVIERVNASGAGVMFLGIGCPKQEDFAFKHRQKIRAVQMCVGAAFDFHAGKVRMAPRWMQQRGLEWLYRLYKEPRRLWKRYVTTNSTFVFLLIRRIAVGR
ncbi:MAG: WecB/TagA/CpsF family glycosyltransferase [Phycisphaerales bacterium JB063]